MTAAKLHTLVDNASISGIVNADVSSGAAIADSKVNFSTNFVSTLTGDQTISGDKDYTGEVDFSGATVTGINSVPSGLISMWSGAVSAIPTGWVICDGNNSTPNLTDRFVIHADADSGGTNDVGDTGGAKTHSLSEAEMPTHDHVLTLDNEAANNTGTLTDNVRTVGASTSTFNTTTSAKGSGTAHTNRDKYYALAFIMRT